MVSIVSLIIRLIYINVLQAYDDGNLLLEKFKFEIDKLSKAFPVTVQKIVAARKCSAYYLAPSSVKLVICAIEAAILFTMDLVRNI